MNLDFSQLSDDQLIQLVRLALQECVSRNPAVEAAARSATLDEAEKARIRVESAEREAAKLRAQERERIAKESAAQVRVQSEIAESERKKAEAEAAKIKQAEVAQAAVREALERDEEEKRWLAEAGGLVDRDPSGISINYFKSRYGVRVLINPSCDKYADPHLVDWNAEVNTIKSARSLMSRKPQLIEFCARFRENYRGPGKPGHKFLAGCDYNFGKEESNGHSDS